VESGAYRRAGREPPALHVDPPPHLQADRLSPRAASAGRSRDVLRPEIR
jgi:hypothetical protein